MHTYKKGFTLIELLVVISIISLLSSIVLASLNSAREKGRIAAGLKYNTANLRTVPSIGYWKLDETGTPASYLDSSGSGSNGVSPTFRPTPNADVPHAAKVSSQYFDGNDYITIPSSTNLNLTTQGFTYMAWVKPTSVTGGYKIIASRYVPYIAISTSSKFRMLLGGRTGGTLSNENVESSVSAQAGRWTHVAGVYDGSSIRIYVDGKLEGTTATSWTTIENYQVPFLIGAMSNNTGGSITNHFTGNIDDVAVLSKALESAEIEKIYAESKNKYLAEI